MPAPSRGKGAVARSQAVAQCLHHSHWVPQGQQVADRLSHCRSSSGSGGSFLHTEGTGPQRWGLWTQVDHESALGPLGTCASGPRALTLWGIHQERLRALAATSKLRNKGVPQTGEVREGFLEEGK